MTCWLSSDQIPAESMFMDLYNEENVLSKYI